MARLKIESPEADDAPNYRSRSELKLIKKHDEQESTLDHLIETSDQIAELMGNT